MKNDSFFIRRELYQYTPEERLALSALRNKYQMRDSEIFRHALKVIVHLSSQSRKEQSNSITDDCLQVCHDLEEQRRQSDEILELLEETVITTRALLRHIPDVT
jgi:hypothetical protein